MENSSNNQNISYPYLPEGREILYVGMDNYYMASAYKIAKSNSLDKTMPTGAVIVGPNEGLVSGFGANGSNYHELHGCERVRRNIPTGEQYELCDGCNPKNHAEIKAIFNTTAGKVFDADLYLWGHWWCCKDCWDRMIKVGIKNVYLLEGSEKYFNKDSSENVIGKQFEFFG